MIAWLTESIPVARWRMLVLGTTLLATSVQCWLLIARVRALRRYVPANDTTD